MNRTLSNVIIFAAGAAIGTGVTYVLTKKKYERIAQEEITDIRKMYQDRMDNLREAEETVRENLDALQKASDSARECLSKIDKKVEQVDEKKRPTLIDYSEFGEDENYEKVTLMFYRDKVLATDDTDEIIENVDEIVGEENLKAFDNAYEEDAIYIRNDDRQTYYEILESLNDYDEIIARSRYAEDK